MHAIVKTMQEGCPKNKKQMLFKMPLAPDALKIN